MINAVETKRFKAQQLRYKKPIVKNLNLDTIKETLWDIQEKCDDVHWCFDVDGNILINALDGNEDEAYEFRMMFADLCAECEQMRNDLAEEWVPDCFDKFFVAIGAGDSYGGLLGFDEYEQDYFGLSCTDAFAKDETQKALKRLSKDELIAASRQCFRVYAQYMALCHRYDCLEAALDILRDENTGYLKMVKQLEEMYDAMEADDFSEYAKSTMDFDRYAENLPKEAWLQ